MKRIQEKVKDLIEVRDYQNLQNFLADPAKTLASYHFTDMTSDLMAKWLDEAVAVQPENGRAMALAGYRGVGKSHFLATFGAILAAPELRSAVTEPHVAAAQQLKRRRHPVAYIKRGTRETLFEELKDAIALVFEENAADLSNDLNQLLKTAAEKDVELPFVLIFDTAFERESRVARDDGVLLGEIAEIAAKLNMFIGVALDDDIAGADGVNASISALFDINYLDQEHLYRIVDAHIFPKNRLTRGLFHDIYEYFRAVLPHFRWSEQRFTSLYPMHPVILEIAPFVRLYAPEFALLGFASVAGAKIMGRPASSLITLDEVFDRVENSLRKVADLKETFAAFDKIGSEVIGQIPVMQRLHAKLILKALLLLSLDGEGTSAGEIGAAMLIYDESDPNKSVGDISQILDSFAAAMPGNIIRTAKEGREVRYYLKTENKETFNNALAETAADISPDVVTQILRRMLREHFTDWNMPDDANWADSQIVWRGGHRRGRVSWSWGEDETLPATGEFLDWELVIVNPEDKITENAADAGEVRKVFWKPAKLRKEDTDTILRFYALLKDEKLRADYSEQIRAAGHMHTLAVEKIFAGIFFNDAKLVIDGFDIEFSDEAKAANDLSGMFSVMLEPLFEGRFSNHPYFAQPLGMSEVSLLVNDLFGGANPHLAETQRLAKFFALPLGLVTLYNDTYIIESEANLKKLPLADKILELANQNPSQTVSLKTIDEHLKKEPFGLVREAQHLILTALVAQRQIEFITTKGDRINRRSLDLQIIWDDIEGIAKPAGKTYSSQRLTDWARILTGEDNFKTIDVPEDEEKILVALNRWLLQWNESGVIERFNALPDDILNVKIWHISVQAEKTFGTVAETVKSILDNFIPLEEGLHRIADTFSDSEEKFSLTKKNPVILDDFISGAKSREKIWSYLAICENTDNEELELLREKILELLDENYHQPDSATNLELENLWQKFLKSYSEHFAVNHDFVMKSHHLQENFDEIMRSDAWWEFESLSKFEIFRPTFWEEAQKNCRQFKELDCHFDVREMLSKHPFCACSFNLSQISEWEKLPETLRENINQGRTSYRRTLQMLDEDLTPMLDEISKKDDEFTAPATNLILRLKEKGDSTEFSNQELIILQKVLSQLKG